jgi:hypothetical protein
MDKQKNTKEPYLLNDDEHIGEVEKRTVATYDKEKDKPEEITKALKRAKDGDVSFNDDGTISVKEGDVNEVEKTTVMKFDIKQGGDVKSLQQMLDKGVDSKKITVGTDGTISVVENTVLKVGDLLNSVNNFNKINLSESEIMSIIVKSQNPRMTKSELMETISNNLIFEANMDDELRRKFESGDNDYRDILGRELTNKLAQENFREIADNIRRKMGVENPDFMDVQRFLMSSLVSAAQEEYRVGTDFLERKAVDMIRKQYNIPVDAVDFQVTITGLPPEMFGLRNPSQQTLDTISRQQGVKVGKIDRQGLKMTKGVQTPPQGKTEEQLKPKIKRRRLTNALMQGAARKSQNLHHMDDELRQTSQSLNNDYSNIMAANDVNYFLMSDELIQQQGESGIHAGNVRLDLSGERPKIIAQGMVFPILLHELSKGVVELMSLWGLEKDPEIRKYVLDKTDNLESETNDIRLGTKIWERFVALLPADNQEVLSLVWNRIQLLPDDEFNSLIEGLVEDKTDTQQKIRRMADEALQELRDEEYQEALGDYEDDDQDYDDKEGELLEPGDDEKDPFLSGLESDEDDGVDYENMSKRDLELTIDDALDAGDMDLVRYLGSILNKK